MPNSENAAANPADGSWVEEHLLRRGLVGPGDRLEVRELTGGVSSEVYSVRAPAGDMVIKRSLAQLRVAEAWLANPGRVVGEGHALSLAGRLIPERVPRVLDLDEEGPALVIEKAPPSWREWRQDLLDGRCDRRVATRVGEALAILHRNTTQMTPELERFRDQETFVQLRVDPFHRTLLGAHPDLAAPIQGVIDRLVSTPTCLVHGDFSPKNFLTDDGEVWILDWEVAHRGNPEFDLAYLVSHLAIKAVHRESEADLYRELAREFLHTYEAAGGAADIRGIHDQVACLILARVDGKSRAAYLSETERRSVRSLGRRLLATPLSDVTELWEFDYERT